MSGFRGTDERLEEEIAALEGIVRLRLRRAAADFQELDRQLAALKRERARRRARAVSVDGVPADAVAELP